MAFLYNAGQIAQIIRKLGEMDIADLGNNESNQNTYIYFYMNIVLMKLARLAYNTVYSDEKTLSADGYVTFNKGAQAITDMFEPIQIYDPANPNGKRIEKRTADEAPKGWWRDSNNLEIHIRGFSLVSQPLLSGSYVLKYIKYPARVTIDTDVVELPPSGYDTLIKEVLALIKYSKNSFGDAEFLDAAAKKSVGSVMQGSVSARGYGGASGTPTGSADTQIIRGG